MFNSTQGRAASISKIEQLSDQIAADLDDLLNDGSVDRHTKETFFEQFATLAASRKIALEFAQGTFAQGNSGQPAKALGTGSAPSSEQEALSFLLNSGSLPQGLKALLKRAINPSDPDHIEVGVDGTPKEVGQLRQELQTTKADLKDAQTELAKEKAKKPAPATDVVAKAALGPKVVKLKTQIEGLSDGLHRPGTPSKKDAAIATADEIIKDLS